MPLKNDSHLDTLLYTDDQVLLADTEDDIQCSVYNLHFVAKEFNMEISTTKRMAFQGKELVRSKIFIENTTLEQANNLNYLAYNLTYKGEIDVEKKLEKFNRALRIKTKYFTLKTFKNTQDLKHLRH
jgi:hypothetical protein